MSQAAADRSYASHLRDTCKAWRDWSLRAALLSSSFNGIRTIITNTRSYRRPSHRDLDEHSSPTRSMSQALASIWEASASQPFEPAVSKEQQFSVGFTLLLFALICSSIFGLSMQPQCKCVWMTRT